MSWIDPQTGLPEVDDGGHPGSTTTRSVIVGEVVYRFSNFLEAKIILNDDRSRITGTEFTSASGMYRSPSYLGTESAPIGSIGRQKTVLRNGTQARFRQVVGCRTVAPEVIGRRTGLVGGAIAGAWGGAAAGAAVAGVGAIPGAIVGGIGGAAVGYFTGQEVAEAVTGFPPIWTEIELTIELDGTASQRLISHSLFPSCTFYGQDLAGRNGTYRQVSNYNAVPALDRWKANGWGDAAAGRSGGTPGNPWNMVSGNNRLGRATVNRDCPTGYQCQ